MIFKFFLEEKNNRVPTNPYSAPTYEIRSLSFHSACQEIEKKLDAKLIGHESLQGGKTFRVYYEKKGWFKKPSEFIFYVETDEENQF